MKKLRIGVIGCGRISSRHLDAARDLDCAELVAVCDIKPERVASTAEKYSALCYTDYKKMMDEIPLDAIHICLPHYLHTEVAQYALNHGVNVLSEKPMSIKYEDAVRTVQLAESKGLKYGVIFQCRYNTTSQLIKRRITDGRLGKVKCSRVVLTWNRLDEYYVSSDWKGTWDKEGGGVVIDQAIHSLDLANWFIDSVPVEIQSTLHNRNHSIIKVEDTAEGFIKYENGTSLVFYTMNSYLIDEPIEIRLYCDHGTARISYNDATIYYDDGTVETIKNSPQKIVSYDSIKEYWGMQHAVQINQFYQSVLGRADLEITGREALKIQKIICDIYDNDDSGLGSNRRRSK